MTDKEFSKMAMLVQKIKYDPHINWSPEIYVENAIGDPKESSSYSLELDKLDKKLNHISVNNLIIKVTEKRRIDGFFYERLELYDFPIDIQELSIKLSSKKSIDQVVLVKSKQEPSGVNTENFEGITFLEYLIFFV